MGAGTAPPRGRGHASLISIAPPRRGRPGESCPGAAGAGPERRGRAFVRSAAGSPGTAPRGSPAPHRPAAARGRPSAQPAARTAECGGGRALPAAPGIRRQRPAAHRAQSWGCPVPADRARCPSPGLSLAGSAGGAIPRRKAPLHPRARAGSCPAPGSMRCFAAQERDFRTGQFAVKVLSFFLGFLFVFFFLLGSPIFVFSGKIIIIIKPVPVLAREEPGRLRRGRAGAVPRLSAVPASPSILPLPESLGARAAPVSSLARALAAEGALCAQGLGYASPNTGLPIFAHVMEQNLRIPARRAPCPLRDDVPARRASSAVSGLSLNCCRVPSCPSPRSEGREVLPRGVQGRAAAVRSFQGCGGAAEPPGLHRPAGRQLRAWRAAGPVCQHHSAAPEAPHGSPTTTQHPLPTTCTSLCVAQPPETQLGLQSRHRARCQCLAGAEKLPPILGFRRVHTQNIHIASILHPHTGAVTDSKFSHSLKMPFES